MNIEVNNKQLEFIGLINPDNRVELKTADVTSVGAVVQQSGAKKAVKLQMTVPISRSGKGTRRVASFSLNGSQMRELYETLNEFYQVQTEAGNV